MAAGDHALDIDIAPATDAARSWILSSWLRSQHDVGGVFRGAPASYWREHTLVVERLLADSAVLVATFAGEPDLFAGYLVARGEVLHYVYTKQAYRRDGVATRLIAKYPIKLKQVSHLGRDNAWLVRRGITYNPYTLMRICENQATPTV